MPSTARPSTSRFIARSSANCSPDTAPSSMCGTMAPTAATVSTGIVTARLLKIDMLAGAQGQDRHRRVPMVRRGDGRGIQGFVLQRLPEVLESVRLRFLLLRGGLYSRGDGAVVHIADIRDLDARQAGQAFDVGHA